MRSSADKIERLLHYRCNSRTLDDWSEQEGRTIIDTIQLLSREILKENEFDEDTGLPVDISTLEDELKNPDIASISPEKVLKAIVKHNENRPDDEKISEEWANTRYFSASEGVNISIDDVGVTEQKSTGRQKGSPPKDKKKRVENTVVHIQQGFGTYVFTGLGMLSVVKTTLAFSLANNLLENHMVTFFVDGAPNIRNSIQSIFGFRPYEVVLDWHHLDRKCAQRLSQIMKGIKLRNEAYKSLVKFLWYGELDKAIEFLRNIPEDKIKHGGLEHIEKLIDYFERNRNNIPCYSLRKELGLRNSSNRVEKSNDLIVAERQKNRGMSWSRAGSTALANITAMRLNGESSAWNYTKQLRFSLNYYMQNVA